MSKVNEVFGLSFLKAPGGGLVLVAGPMDLSRASSLSPVWTRELRETRPTRVALPPDKQNGQLRAVTAAVLTKVGETRVHGESAGRVAKRINAEVAQLLTDVLAGKETSLEVLEALVPPPPKPRQEFDPKRSDKDKRLQAERAMGFIGLPDAEVRRRLLEMGRKRSDVDRYLAKRDAA